MIGHELLKTVFAARADAGELAHAYILFGPARVGKFRFAREFAAYLESGRFEDIPALTDAVIEGPDEAGTIGIDRVREMHERLWQAPARSAYRTLIVNDADAMTTEAQNALLKIAEEPPKSGLILLIVNDTEKLLPTLQSRFQKVYFAPVAEKAIAEWLVREYKMPSTQARTFALRAHGLPGLAYALAYDTSVQQLLAHAERFLAFKDPSVAKEFVKDLVDDEAFAIDAFLEALAIASVPVAAGRIPFWHRLLELRRNASYFNLNPRLHLLALLATNR